MQIEDDLISHPPKAAMALVSQEKQINGVVTHFWWNIFDAGTRATNGKFLHVTATRRTRVLPVLHVRNGSSSNLTVSNSN